MQIKYFSYRYIGLLLAVAFVFWHSFSLHAQNSEFDKLFEEATEQQYNNPMKSLELYQYLLKTDLTKDSEFSVQLKKLHTYHILGQYVQMVETLQKLEKVAPSINNKELLLEFWLEKSLLYPMLSFPKEAKNSLLKAEELFETCTNIQKNKNQKYIEFANYSLEDFDNETERIERLKNIRSYWNESQANYDWFSYQLGEYYFDVDKDSSLYYFKTLITSQNQLLSPIAILHIEILQNEEMDYTYGVNQILEEDNLSLDMKISFLERIVNYYDDNTNQEELVWFTDALDTLKNERSILKRRAKSLLLESIYYNKREAKILNTQKIRERQNFIILGLSTLILSYLIFSYYRKKQQVAKAEKDVAKSNISSKTEEEILLRLNQFEKSTLYLDKQLRIADLAKYLKTNTRYLSVILNEKKNKSFNSYINQLRVAYIIDKLHNEPIYLSYKISYLAKESGFASQSSFSSSFKEVTGMPPSTYIKTITEKKTE